MVCTDCQPNVNCKSSHVKMFGEMRQLSNVEEKSHAADSILFPQSYSLTLSIEFTVYANCEIAVVKGYPCQMVLANLIGFTLDECSPCNEAVSLLHGLRQDNM